MSKKVVSFALPPARKPEARTAPQPSPRQSDNWVHDRRSPANPSAPSADGHVVIDLSVNRSWFELIHLIAIFPYLATSAWMQTATQAWLGSFKQR